MGVIQTVAVCEICRQEVIQSISSGFYGGVGYYKDGDGGDGSTTIDYMLIVTEQRQVKRP